MQVYETHLHNTNVHVELYMCCAYLNSIHYSLQVIKSMCLMLPFLQCIQQQLQEITHDMNVV